MSKFKSKSMDVVGMIWESLDLLTMKKAIRSTRLHNMRHDPVIWKKEAKYKYDKEALMKQLKEEARVASKTEDEKTKLKLRAKVVKMS